MSLDNYSDDDLIKEIERRKAVKPDRPQRRNASDTWILNNICETVESCLRDAIEEDYWDENHKQYIFEATMQSIFGDDYFDWHSKRFHS